MKLDLDHCGVVVKDLDRARDNFVRLGFTLTSRSFHAGARLPGGPVEPWGSANHCAMFSHGYLEIIGITDASLYSSVKDLVERYEGAHIVAFGCNGDAGAAHAGLVRRGVAAEAPRSLQRQAAFGPNDEQTRQARFRNIYLDPNAYPEARFLIIEHLTRDVLWQPHLLEHPNGVLSIEECWFASPDARTTAENLAQLTGRRVERGAGVYRLRLARGALVVMEHTRWRALGPGTMPPPDSPVGMVFRIASLADTAALFDRNEVQFGRSAHALAISASDACGAALSFRQ